MVHLFYANYFASGNGKLKEFTMIRGETGISFSLKMKNCSICSFRVTVIKKKKKTSKLLLEKKRGTSEQQESAHTEGWREKSK